MTNQEKFVQTFGVDVWQQMIVFSGLAEQFKEYWMSPYWAEISRKTIEALAQKSKVGYCKDCKYFEYDRVAKVDGIPLIVAHEICSRWGDGCKTKEDGYCFLFVPQERSDKE